MKTLLFFSLFFCSSYSASSLGSSIDLKTTKSQETQNTQYLLQTKIKFKRNLDSLKQEDAIKKIFFILSDKQYNTSWKWSALHWLVERSGRASEKILLRYTKHPSWELRLAGLRLIHALNMHSLPSVLKRTLQDPAQIIQEQSLKMFNKGHLHFYKNELKQLIAGHQNMTEKNDSFIRHLKNSQKILRQD